MICFISKFSSIGNFLWGCSFGSNGNLNRTTSDCIEIDNFNNIYTTGSFEAFTDFDPDSNISYLISNGLSDSFILKLTQCKETHGWLADEACNFFISPSGNFVWTTSGNYFDTLTNSVGCDSVIEIELTIYSVDTSVTQITNTLTANASGATYQWIDCGNGNVPIAGAISQSFTPVLNGSYACIITQNGCTDTSGCYIVNTIGIENVEFPARIKVYPNPAYDFLSVDFGHIIAEGTIEIVDPQGKVVLSRDISNSNKIVLPLHKLDAGLYGVKMQLNNNPPVTKHFIIE